METFSALLAICAGNSPVTAEFLAQRPVTRSFDVFFDLLLNKRLSKQSWGWWFETLSRLLWRHRNDPLSHNSAEYSDVITWKRSPHYWSGYRRFRFTSTLLCGALIFCCYYREKLQTVDFPVIWDSLIIMWLWIPLTKASNAESASIPRRQHGGTNILNTSKWENSPSHYWNQYQLIVITGTGPRLNIKTVLSTYGDFHVKDKTAVLSLTWESPYPRFHRNLYQNSKFFILDHAFEYAVCEMRAIMLWPHFVNTHVTTCSEIDLCQHCLG